MIIEPQRRKELREKYLCVLCAFAVKKSTFTEFPLHE
jgi:hypothetical protein